MINYSDNFERRRLQQRIVQLRNQLNEISGGEAVLGAGPDSTLSLEEEVAFLERVIACGTGPKTTWIDRLRKAGYDMPDPTTLSDAEIELEVWQVIQRLSEVQAYLDSTDHLSDRELYEGLFFDGAGELPGIQHTLAITLWRMGLVAQDWLSLEQLEYETLLPAVSEAIQQEAPLIREPGIITDIRLWRYLTAFGLLDPNREISSVTDHPLTY